VGLEAQQRFANCRGEREFLVLCQRVGFVGAKIDFFDHEAKEIIDVYQAMLRSSAEHRIMVEFHGANKPAGESRTWPNEMTREAIRGLEYRSMQTRARHNVTLPFTRFLAGTPTTRRCTSANGARKLRGRIRLPVR